MDDAPPSVASLIEQVALHLALLQLQHPIRLILVGILRRRRHQRTGGRRAVKKLNRFPAALISANKLPLIVTLECLG